MSVAEESLENHRKLLKKQDDQDERIFKLPEHLRNKFIEMDDGTEYPKYKMKVVS
jgi:hypothetical protein